MAVDRHHPRCVTSCGAGWFGDSPAIHTSLLRADPKSITCSVFLWLGFRPSQARGATARGALPPVLRGNQETF